MAALFNTSKLLTIALLVGAAFGQVSGSSGVTGTTSFGVETFGMKLRRLAGEAIISNPATNNPISPPAAWVIGTAYIQGQVVTNGANQYICAVAGTSAGSGGPTGTGMGAIIDNTVTWYWFGLSVPASAGATAPTITQSATTTLTNVYAYNASPSPFAFSGGPVHVSGSSQYNFPCATTIPPATTTNCHWWVTFVTDAVKVAVKTTSSTNAVRFIVDGQYVTVGGYPNGSGANPSYNIIDFTSAGARKARTIRVEGHNNTQFGGVVVGATEEVWAPPTASKVKAIFESDSIFSGGGGFSDLSGLDVRNVCNLVGWSDCTDAAVGGTGYVAVGGFSTFVQRVAYDITPYAPDVVVLQGSINDSGTASATITAAALATFQAIRAGLPSVPIIVFGVWPGSRGPDANLLADENAVSAAVTQFGDSRTYFVPIATDTTQSWITGTGTVAATTGTGNADNYLASDGIHPTDQGRIYLYQRMAKAIRQIEYQIP